MSVIIIQGPMFAGKSTKLINIARAVDNGIMIKFTGDTRYTDDENALVVSHDHVTYPAVPVNALSDVPNALLNDHDNIFLDEGQFFPDLLEFIYRVRALGKNLYIAGLDLNHRRENFGKMKEAAKLADKVVQLTATCVQCNGERGPAIYTRMTTTAPELRGAEIVVGGAELYQPVCEYC